MSNPWGPPEGQGPAEGGPQKGPPPPGGPPPVYPQPGAPAPPPYGYPPYGPGSPASQPSYGGQPSFGGQPGYPAGGAEQPGYPQPAYGQPAYGSPFGPGGYGQRSPETDQNAIVALVLAVLSWMLCPVILAIVALVMAGNAQRAIDASQGARTGDGLVKAARIVSWINIAFYAAFLVFGLIILIVAIAAAPDTRTTY